MSSPAREGTLAALAILRERLLQAVEALDAAHAALVAEAGAAPDAAWSGEEVGSPAEEAAPPTQEAGSPTQEAAPLAREAGSPAEEAAPLAREVESLTQEASPPTVDAPLAADGPSVADLTRRFDAIRAQLAALGVRAAGDPDVTPPA